ncbi:ABC transporter permease [Arthrobacter sp. ZGTC212]|uniref:ABC transporter permease n=1 Tax=Arthrobacter sp. ZGTC212 TaxID=2058899 RepID=UPI000CE2FEF6|nr:ABC transporter permease [Arthrobacter sp. ZGTC212]
MTSTAQLSTFSPEPQRRFDGMRRSLPPRTPKLVIGLGITVAIALFGLIGPLLVTDPMAISNIGLSGPSGEHLLGTTQTGQDVLAQLAHATRGSLIVGVTVGFLAVALSGLVGILGAYLGGRWDESFSLFTNVALVIPGIPLMIVVASYVEQKGLLMIIVVLTLTSWAGGARVLRAQTLSMRNRDYVLAAKVAGEPTWRIILVEILPNLLPVLASQFVFAVIFAILGESSLSFLGLGVSGTFSWGSMLFYAQNAFSLRLGAWWWFIPPGLMIALLGAGLALINFAIDEVINPKLRLATAAKAARKATR